MFAIAFWIGSKALMNGRGLSFFLCGMIAMPFDGYFLAKTLGFA